jgi:hypothetical protein
VAAAKKSGAPAIAPAGTPATTPTR